MFCVLTEGPQSTKDGAESVRSVAIDEGRIVEAATRRTICRQEDDLLRRMLRGLIIFLVGAGLIAAVYAMRPDVHRQQPPGPANSASTAMTRPSPTGPEHNGIVANGVKPISWDRDTATIRPEDAKHRATMPARRSAPADRQVRVRYRENPSVRRQLNAPPVQQASLTESARRPGSIMTAGWSSQAP